MTIVAPFLGEFGWEVALWAPWLRWMQREVWKSTDLRVLCRPGHGKLYEGMGKVIDAHLGELDVERIDCQNAWAKGHGLLRREEYVDIIHRTLLKKRVGPRVVTPHDLQVTWRKGEPPTVKRGIHEPLNVMRKHPNDKVLLHVRACPDKQPERNWDKACAEEVARTLRERGLRVYTVGKQSQSAALMAATGDLRGLDLEGLAAETEDACAIIGPSSGPMHFANYCTTPAIWWSGNRKDCDRYRRHWNPFNLENRQVAMDWHPSAGEILMTFDQAQR